MSERHASGAQTDYAYYTCDNSPVVCPFTGVTVLAVSPDGGAPAWEIQDILGRTIRKLTTAFDGSKVFIDSFYDILGRPVSISEPYKEGDTVYWNTSSYDLLGRIIGMTNASGQTETVTYSDYTTTTVNPLGQQKTERRNVLGQLVQVIDNLNNTIDYIYDVQGNLIRTLQTAADTGATAETSLTYDRLGRKIAMDDEDKGQWHYDYNALGQLVEQTDAKGQKVQLTYDLLGRKLQRIDRRADGSIEGNTVWTYDQGTFNVLSKVKDSISGYEQSFSYDNYGRPTGIITRFDDETYQQLTTYDPFGRLATEIDAAGPDSGLRYEYNSHGFMAAIYDLKTNQEWYRVNSMDVRGNVTVQTIAGIQQAKYYDPLTGFIESIKSHYSLAMGDDSSLQNNSYQWDEVGNLLSRTEKGQTETFTYDGLNRLTGSAYSYEKTVTRYERYITGEYEGEVAECHKFRHLSKEDIVSRGFVRSEEPEITDDEEELRVCRGFSDRGLKDEETEDRWKDRGCDDDPYIPGCENILRGIDYAVIYYDVPVTFVIKKYYAYGYRPVTTTETAVHRETIEYDGLGNISYKSNVGFYTYGANGAGNHAVTATRINQRYSYDANGNMLSGSGRTLSYTTFDKPNSITKSSNSISFGYNVNRKRYKREDKQNGRTKSLTHYVGNVEFIKSGAETEIRRNINGIVIVTYTLHDSGTIENATYKALLKDHLGSVNAIIAADGIVITNGSFSAFGESRDPQHWETLISFDPSDTRRGFTGHEHLSDVGLIHMNGRIYDPTLGRFLQADPFIQAASNTQSFNRYSYVLNNPLNAVDPSGFFFKKAFRAITKPFRKAARSVIRAAVKVFGAEAVNLVGNIVSGYFGGPMGVAAWNYEFGRAMGASPGQAFKSAAIAGASAFAFQSIGSAFDANTGFWASGGAGHIGAHAITGGIIAELQGGKFGHGFISAGFTKFAMSNMLPDSAYDDISWEAVSGRTAIAAIIGGTASELTGGKFANGARTAAMAHLFNAERIAREKSSNNLGLVGNQIKNRLTSEYEKQLFARYWNGIGDLILSDEEFMAAVNAAKSLTVTSTFSVEGNEHRVVSFYGNSNLDQAYGRATLIYNSQGGAVGFKDFYDFDSKNWGVRPFKSEVQTRMVNYSGTVFGNAKPYKICHGAGC